MPAIYYPAIIESGDEPGYSVFFPDLPGLASAGDTEQEAALNAEEALQGHLNLLLRDGDEIPDPSSLDDVPSDPEIKEVARILVRANMPGKTVRLNISLDEALLKDIDSEATSRGMTRSGFLADLARQAIEDTSRR